MVKLDIPGSPPLEIAHLVLDYNGTLARDGELLEGVGEILRILAGRLTIHVLTADTHGTVRERLGSLPCRLHVIPPEEQDRRKSEYVRSLGSRNVLAVGNGRNDSRMLGEAALGIGVIQSEGAAADVLRSASVICTSIRDALELLVFPARLQATLRN